MKTSKAKQTYSVRIHPDKRAKAEKLGLNMAELFELTLDKALDERRCPCCNQKLKRKSN